MLRIAIVRSAQGLESLRSAWERLYRAGEYSIFQSPEWNLLAARVFSRTTEPLVIHAESDSGAAIIPACISNGDVSLLGDALFDYRNTLARGDHEVVRRAWEQVATAQRSLSVTALYGEDPCRHWQRLGFAPVPFCNAPAVRRSDVSAGQFAADHNRSARLLRRVARAGADVVVHAGSEEALVRHIYESKAQQVANMPQNLFANRDRIDFMTAIAAKDAGCEIFTLETAGSLVAALVTFREGGIRRFYTTYYDHAWAQYSPGIALLFEATRRSLEQGLDCDYMTGEQPHKMRFATHLAPLFRVETRVEDLARIARARMGFEDNRAPLPLAA